MIASNHNPFAPQTQGMKVGGIGGNNFQTNISNNTNMSNGVSNKSLNSNNTAGMQSMSAD